MELRVVEIVQRLKLLNRFLLPQISMRQIMTARKLRLVNLNELCTRN
jgi:hypothetical protein